MVEKDDDTQRKAYGIKHFQYRRVTRISHDHNVKFLKNIRNANIVMISHNGKCRPEETDCRYKRDLQYLQKAFVPVHIHQFHQGVRLSDILHGCLRTGLSDQGYDPGQADCRFLYPVLFEFMHFDRLYFGCHSVIVAYDFGNVLQKYVRFHYLRILLHFDINFCLRHRYFPPSFSMIY